MSGQRERLHASYIGRKVLVTGDTGFKGTWLATWLIELGADVGGFALAPPTSPAMFDAVGLERRVRHTTGDIRDLAAVGRVLDDFQPDLIFHLAAQPLVRASYAHPLETIETNVSGTANLLECVRQAGRPCAIIVVTSDKCYENRERERPYRETDPLGGSDVYSMSKAGQELVSASFRRSFFPPASAGAHGVRLATARSGNAVGGGDWAEDRLVPDCIRALSAGRTIRVRHPGSVRPWQHVLDPLAGYLLLGSRLMSEDAAEAAPFCDAWNFGPDSADRRNVQEVVEAVIKEWGSGSWERDPAASPHEAGLLLLDASRARELIGWRPRWSFDESVRRTVRWYAAFYGKASDVNDLTIEQIRQYMERDDA